MSDIAVCRRKHWTIRESGITSESLKYLNGLTSLKSLNVASTRVDDLTPIEHYSHLEPLGLGSSKVRDDDLKSLVKFSNLQTRHAGYLELTEVGLSYVGKCSNLQVLGRKNTKLT